MPRLIDPANQYHGTPCRKCGGTLRYNSSGSCVRCMLTRHRPSTRAARAVHGANARKIVAKPAKPLRDPTAGAAFPASRARLMGAK